MKKYRMLRKKEIKRPGDELKGNTWEEWVEIIAEIGKPVTDYDLDWGQYRRPVKKGRGR